MRNRFSGTLLTTAAAAVAFFLSLAVKPNESEGQAYRAPRLSGTAHPNLSGIWQAMNTANYDIQAHPARPALAVRAGPVPGSEVPRAPVLAFGAVGGVPAGLGVVEGNEIPYQPWAAVRKKENFENWLTRDPEIRCYLPGVPRATYMPFPFQIVQSTNIVFIVYESGSANRTIYMDRAESSPIDTWMGHSIGRWDGDTLVVDVTSFNDQTWFDRAGNFHSEALHVIERYTPVSFDHLSYEVTIEDPKVFTRPWKMRMPLYRRKEPTAQILEYKCQEFVEELLYGHLSKQPSSVMEDYRRWYTESRNP